MIDYIITDSNITEADKKILVDFDLKHIIAEMPFQG
jgi:hypothetical protein